MSQDLSNILFLCIFTRATRRLAHQILPGQKVECSVPLQLTGLRSVRLLPTVTCPAPDAQQVLSVRVFEHASKSSHPWAQITINCLRTRFRQHNKEERPVCRAEREGYKKGGIQQGP